MQTCFWDKLAVGRMSMVKAEGRKLIRLVVDSLVCGTQPYKTLFLRFKEVVRFPKGGHSNALCGVVGLPVPWKFLQSVHEYFCCELTVFFNGVLTHDVFCGTIVDSRWVSCSILKSVGNLFSVINPFAPYEFFSKHGARSFEGRHKNYAHVGSRRSSLVRTYKP